MLILNDWLSKFSSFAGYRASGRRFKAEKKGRKRKGKIIAYIRREQRRLNAHEFDGR